MSNVCRDISTGIVEKKMIELKTALQQVKHWAKHVGDLQLSYFRTNQFTIGSKSTEADLVTDVDKQSEAYLINAINVRFPSHGIIAEESGGIDNDYCWIIDPLDGTTNFANGLPLFCISIALQYQHETVLGVVYAPYLRELFYAIKGAGAYLNDEKLSVSRKQDVKTCVVCTGFPYNKATNKDNNLENVNSILPNVRGFRRLGAAAYDLSLVAGGFLDGFWEPNLKIWDVAAGLLLVQEAGGCVHYYREDGSHSLVCGNATIVTQLTHYLS